MWLNVTTLVGRATADPKQRETAGGTRYATLRLAVPRGRGETDFFTVELWGKLATVALSHVHRGVVVTVRAELKQQAWVADGQRRERVVITARSLGIIQNPVHDLGDVPVEPNAGDIDLDPEVAA
jgi:single-strand DNA-binding protein